MENKKAFSIIFLTVFIDLVGFGLIIPILPNYAKELGASDAEFGLIVSVYSLLNFVLRLSSGLIVTVLVEDRLF